MRLEAAVVRARPQLRRAMQAWQSNRQQCLEEAKACHKSALKFEAWRELFGTTFRFPTMQQRALLASGFVIGLLSGIAIRPDI